MTTQGLSIESNGRLFRHCVQDCARDDRMVTAYNQLYGTQLTAPIEALLKHDEEPGPSPDTQEGAELARFILFCYDTVWRHVRRARQRATSWQVTATLATSPETTDEPADATSFFDDGLRNCPSRDQSCVEHLRPLDLE
jgi:hypothetical protein